MSITIPDEAAENPRRLVEEMLCALWSKGAISSGKAAEFLGIGRPEFWDLAGRRGYTWPLTVEDLEADLGNLRALGLL